MPGPPEIGGISSGQVERLRRRRHDLRLNGTRRSIDDVHSPALAVSGNITITGRPMMRYLNGEALGLSRAALPRILEVDPATVYRQEQRNSMSSLWYYALVGIEVEARSRASKFVRKSHKKDAAVRDVTRGATRMEAEGLRHTAERTRQDDQERSKPTAGPKSAPAALRICDEPRTPGDSDQHAGTLDRPTG
jgi:hypothetical protein